MGAITQFLVYLFALFSMTLAMPPRTTIEAHLQAPASMTETAALSAITAGPRLRCSDGSTLLYTTDCTMGTPVSFCDRPDPPLQCGLGFFPSVWHPDHCMQQSTCFPLNAGWITTECSNGAVPYTTTTFYEGTLADGYSTVISAVSCSCATDQWYSMTLLPGSPRIDTFCMPYSVCPRGMTTSVRTNRHCATAPSGLCSDTIQQTDYCVCADPAQRPVYPEEPGSAPTSCA